MVRLSVSDQIKLYTVDETIVTKFLHALLDISKEYYPKWDDAQRTKFNTFVIKYISRKDVMRVISGRTIDNFKDALNLTQDARKYGKPPLEEELKKHG